MKNNEKKFIKNLIQLEKLKIHSIIRAVTKKLLIKKIHKINIIKGMKKNLKNFNIYLVIIKAEIKFLKVINNLILKKLNWR